MKKWIVMSVFFYVSWSVTQEKQMDYSGKEDKYGVVHSTIPYKEPESAEEKDRVLFSGGYHGRYVHRHRSFEKTIDLLDFLRHAPQEFGDLSVTEFRNPTEEFLIGGK